MMNLNPRYIIPAAITSLALIGGVLWFTGVMTFREGSFLPEFSLDAFTSSNPPSLDRALVFPDSFSEEAKSILTKNVETLKKFIQDNPGTAISAWLDLAIQYKTIGDYDGAIQVWKYLVARYPNDATPLYNLGSTYHLFLKDFGKSERYYKEAIERSPSLTVYYTGLRELYRYSYKQDTTLAADVLLQALEHVEGDQRIDIYLALGSYYNDKGDKESAIKYYTKAREGAVSMGNMTLIKQIDTA